MGSREEALRRIFDATGVGPRLTGDQKRELLSHLEDAVDAKVAAGVPEMDAVGQAFSELGDLRTIAGRFPDPAPSLATAAGGTIAPTIGGMAEMGYALLLFFTFVQYVIAPPLLRVFVKVKVPMPSLTILFFNASEAMQRFWPAVALALAGLLIAVIRVRRSGKRSAALDLALGLTGAVLLAAVIAGLLLPFVGLIEGMR